MPVQQLGNALGTAIVTTVYVGAVSSGGRLHGFLATVGAIAAVLILCLPFTWLLPRTAPANGSH
ncbi:hypothetical protein [Streptomyces sp. B1-3]|uniref:hypothetical protein n=1 Tax=Streptomyces sp. B1-3 TaxID=3141453 RepID=UPI003D2E0CC5